METKRTDIDPDNFIPRNIGAAALYEQLAEEASELAQAALKASRILRGNNPTPVKPSAARDNLIEEYTDVCLVAKLLGLHTDEVQIVRKKQRWVNRIVAQQSRKNQSL